MTGESLTPEQAPSEVLSARLSDEHPGVGTLGGSGGSSGPQAGTQDADPRAVTLDAISTALNSAGYWLPIEGKRAVAAGFEYGVGDEARAIVERVRNAAAIADATDVTDWQRGYRACADRVLAALQSEEQP